MIEAWIEHRRRIAAPGAIKVQRIRLYVMYRALQNEPLAPEAHHRQHNLSGSEPHGDAELLLIRSCVNGQPTKHRRIATLGIAALGVGAGLRQSEMIALRTDQVIDHGLDTGIEMRLADRTLWCDADWEDDLRTVLAHATGSEHLLVYQGDRSKWVLHAWMSRTMQHGFNPTTVRMRATWIVRLANRGTTIPTILQAAGLSSASSLMPLQPWLTGPDPSEYRACLRGRVELLHSAASVADHAPRAAADSSSLPTGGRGALKG